MSDSSHTVCGAEEPGEDDYFCVETYRDAAGLNLITTRFFATLEAATAFADLSRVGYQWLSEWGAYRKKSDDVEETWIYFWWSPNTDWGKPEQRTFGVPHERRRPVDYWPLDPAYRPPPWRLQSRADLNRS